MALSDVKNHTASRRKFLLVVDSNEESLSRTSQLLDRFQYRICAAHKGEETLEILEVITPALIIVSQKLDDMIGLDLLRKLKQAEATRRIPVIIMMAKKEPAHERTCLSAGAVVCLTEPCQVEDLFRVVQMTIEPIPRMNMRIPTDLQVTINNPAKHTEEGGSMRILSEQGAYVTTSRPYPLRTRLTLQIDLAGSQLPVEAEVIYASKAGPGPGQQPGMGLQFLDIAPQDQLRIRQYIRQEIDRGIHLSD